LTRVDGPGMPGHLALREPAMTFLRLAAAVALCWAAVGCRAIDSDPILGTHQFQPGETFHPPATG